MKAILHTKYGPPDELQLKEVEKPVPKEDELLIKIYATTVTSSDCNLRNLTFCPKMFLLPMRMQFGLIKPKINIPIIHIPIIIIVSSQKPGACKKPPVN